MGVTTGAVSFIGTLYWLSGVMSTFGGLNGIVSVGLMLLLVAYLSLFPGLFALTVRRLSLAYGARALMAAPAIWVVTELGRTRIGGGFPWVLLGYSQVSVLPVAQFASLFGVYGVSGLVVAVSAALAALVLLWTSRRYRAPGSAAPHARPTWPLTFAAVVTAVVAGVALWGQQRVAKGELLREGEPVKVGLVQGNVDQAQKWDQSRAASIFAEYLRLTRRAIDAGAALVLWPESSTPFLFEENTAEAAQVRTMARAAGVPILVGSDQVERGTPTRYYNAAFLVGPDGADAGVYRKMHLVPFGEYVPLKSLLFFAAPLVEAVSDFSPGDAVVVLPAGGHRFSTAICYEIVYPDLVRQFAANGSELLTTITNDAWFGRTSAPYQHFAQASMRAIENGRFLVRSANTGISGVVDPYGRVLATSALFEPAVVVGEARYLRTTTFYTRHGDVFAYASGLVAAGLLLHAASLRRRR